MANTRTKSNEKYRIECLEKLMNFFKSDEGGNEWVMQVANNSFGFPFVNDNGDEEVLKVTISVPNGTRDGEPYDLDTESKSFFIDRAEKEEKKRQAEELKARKIEKDKKRREMAKKLKAEREV